MSDANSKSPDEVDEFIRQHLDGRLSDAEFHEFETRLVNDPEFRQRYVVLSDLEANLWDQPYGVATRPAEALGKSYSLRIVAMVAAVLSFVVAYLLISEKDAGDQIAGPDNTETPIVEQEADYPEPEAVVPDPDVAVVTYTEPQIKGMKVGQRLKQGLIEVQEGQLRLEFMCGAHVSVFGPAELLVESQSSATLRYGRAAANVPQRARGFILNSPTAAIYDLGTEFSVNVDDKGGSEVTVMSGEVELSLLGDDGNTRTSRRVNQDEVFHVAEGGEISESETTTSDQEFRFEPPTIESLRVPESYEEIVKASGPTDYWRFSQIEGEQIRNEIEGGPALHVVDSEQDIEVRDGSVFLSRSNKIRHLISEVPLRGVNRTDFSVELWINPSDLTHSTCAGLFPAEDNDAWVHLSVLEVVTETFMKHEPGAFRFLYRSPPGRNTSNSVNAFSSGVMTPGLWHHVVAVRGAKQMQLYLNGHIVRSANVDLQNDAQDFHFMLGQLRRGTTERQYAGAIDEVAIYQRKLNEEEVLSRYRIIVEANENSVSALR